MPGKLLIVEDEPIVALDLQQELEELGCEVTGLAESVDSALLSIEENRPDLALMDIKIDGSLDGIQVARLIRHMYQVPVVFLTSFSDADTLRRAAPELPYGYLTKPFDSRELRATVSVALHKAAVDAQVNAASHLLALAVQGLHEAIVMLSPDGTIQYMNQVAEQMTGLTLLMARALPLNVVLDLIDFDQRLVPIRLGKQEDKVAEEFGRVLCAHSGERTIVDFSVKSLVADDGSLAGHLITLRDATQRMRQYAIDDHLEETDRFDSAPLPMVQLDGDGRVMRINQKLLDDSNLPMDRLVGRSLNALLADPDPRITNQFVSRLLRPFQPIQSIPRP